MLSTVLEHSSSAFFKGDWFYSNLLVDAQPLAHLHINYKEALCVVFAAERWASSWCNKTVFVYCDNTAAVAMINKGSTRDPVMMTYLQHLFWLSATYNFRIRAVHIAGKLNTTADHISRLHEASHFMSFLEFLHQHICSFCCGPHVLVLLLPSHRYLFITVVTYTFAFYF